MKILCILVVLANIFLLMWEYRSGAFAQHQPNQEQHLNNGKEQIILWDETKTQRPLTNLKPESENDYSPSKQN